MESHILETLPDINGILIGISIAFYSAFAIYIYQKLDMNREEIIKLVSDAARINTPSAIISDDLSFLNEFSFDWKGKGEPFFEEIREICKGISKGEFPSDNECTEKTFKLCQIFYWIYVTYPFFGTYQDYEKSALASIETKKLQEVTPKRISDIEEILNCIYWVKSHCYEQIIFLAKKCDELELNGKHLQGLNIDNYKVNDLAHISYEEALTEYFSIAHRLMESNIPSLKHAVDSKFYLLKEIKVKTIARNSRAIFIYTFLVGIVFPLLLIESKSISPQEWWIPYLMLICNIIPYFYVIEIVYSRIKKLELK